MSAPASSPVIFGEVLFDRFPDGRSVLGGAPFNVAWNLQAFGLAPLLVSRVGRDAAGQEIRQAMQGWGMSTAFLQEDPRRPTGVVEVALEQGEPSFAIVPEQAYDYIAPVDLEGRQPPLLYHGSLAARQPVSAAALAELRRASAAPVFVDINLRAPWWTPAGVAELLQGARWIKLNQDELARLIPGSRPLRDKAIALLRGSGAEELILTCGAAGAAIVSPDGGQLQVRPARLATAVDTVGAGDAFASVMILGLLRGWTPPVAARRAQEFAAALVEMRGATVTDRNFYHHFLTRWSDDEQSDH